MNHTQINHMIPQSLSSSLVECFYDSIVSKLLFTFSHAQRKTFKNESWTKLHLHIMWGFIPSLNTQTQLLKNIYQLLPTTTQPLLEKKDWVLSFLMICLLSPSSTPLAPSPKQLQPHKKKKQNNIQAYPKIFIFESFRPSLKHLHKSNLTPLNDKK